MHGIALMEHPLDLRSGDVCRRREGSCPRAGRRDRGSPSGSVFRLRQPCAGARQHPITSCRPCHGRCPPRANLSRHGSRGPAADELHRQEVIDARRARNGRPAELCVVRRRRRVRFSSPGVTLPCRARQTAFQEEGCDVKRFEGKVALITGAARGIGLAIATRLLAEGAHVVLADIDGDEAERAVARLPMRAARAPSLWTSPIRPPATCSLVGGRWCSARGWRHRSLPECGPDSTRRAACSCARSPSI